MFKSLPLLAVLCIFTTPVFALSLERSVSPDELQHFFEDETRHPKSRAIQVVGAHAKLDFAFGFADGRYDLANYKIKKVRPNIYALGLVLHKKKGIAIYRQNVVTFFWYDGGNRIVFKNGDHKNVYDIQRTWHLEKRKTASGHDMEFKPQTKDVNVQLNHPAGKVYLTLAVN